MAWALRRAGAGLKRRGGIGGTMAADLAAEIAAVTRREVAILALSRREVERALREGRVALRTEGTRLAGFLMCHDYGAAWEVGTGYVAPAWRGRGLFLEMHHEALARVPAGLPVFGFPGGPSVERTMLRLGFRPVPWRRLPAGVWARLVARRLRPGKLWSIARSAWHGVPRTSRRLHVLGAEGRKQGDQAGPDGGGHREGRG